MCCKCSEDCKREGRVLTVTPTTVEIVWITNHEGRPILEFYSGNRSALEQMGEGKEWVH